MTLTQDGNVGIGTTAPVSALHIDNGLVSVLKSADGTYQTPTQLYHLTPKGYVDSIAASPYQQVVTVAKAGGDYTTIQSAIDSITDAALDKVYTVLVFPGEYADYTQKDYINVVIVDEGSTVINSVPNISLGREAKIVNGIGNFAVGNYCSIEGKESSAGGKYLGFPDYTFTVIDNNTVDVIGVNVASSFVAGKPAYFRGDEGSFCEIVSATYAGGNTRIVKTGGKGFVDDFWETIYGIVGNVAKGNSSHAEGQGTHAEGHDTHAEGYFSHAEGSESHAEGEFSHAEGQSSHAEGGSSHAEGLYSHAEGYGSHAEGYSSHAEGDYSHAEGFYSHAEGENSHAEGSRSHAEGYRSHAEGSSSHAEGNYTHAKGNGSHAEGSESHAEGDNSHAEGHNSHAQGRYSHAEGENSNAEGQNSHAEGQNSYAGGRYSHAEGRSSHAEGENSHAEGHSSQAEGVSSHAEGSHSHAQGYASHTEGDGSYAQGYANHAEGSSSHAEGSTSHAEGSSSHAEGEASHAEGDGSHAYRYSQHSQASGNFSVIGDAQMGRLVMRRSTTNNTPTQLFINGSNAKFTLESGKCYTFQIMITAKNATDNYSASWIIEGRCDDLGDTAHWEQISWEFAETSGSSFATDNVVVSVVEGTPDELKIAVTGQSSKTIRWVGLLTWVEVL